MTTVSAYAELLGARTEVDLVPWLHLDAYVLARIAQDDPDPSLDATVAGETYTGAIDATGVTQL